MEYQTALSGYEIELTGWKNHDYTDFKNINAGKDLKNGDYNTSKLFPNSTTLFMYNPKFFTGPKTVYYNQEKVTSIKNGYHKSLKK